MAHNGYSWWYLDALSDDGRHGLTLIAFIGSVFSPYYASARRRGPADPHDFCALNVVLSAATRRWAMTERRRPQLDRSTDTLAIGPSHLHWDGSALRFEIDEVTCPVPTRLCGSVRFHPAVLPERSFTLDEQGLHQWTPIAPQGRIEVALTHPALRWSGNAYLDANAGREPLESAFSSWHWSRAQLSEGTQVLYDVNRRAGKPLELALQFDHTGGVHEIAPPQKQILAKSRWGIARHTRGDDSAQIKETLLDAPFYARSLVSSRCQGQAITAIHESLSLDRFDTRWVQAMLRFRIPRP